MDVRAILDDKGRPDRSAEVETIRPDADLLLAARLLRAKGIGALVVSPDGVRVDGLVSERDIVVALAEHPELVVRRRVSDVMRHDCLVASPGDDLATVMAGMTRRRQRQVPVVDHGRLVGVISVGDVLNHQLDEVTLEMRVLRDVAIARS